MYFSALAVWVELACIKGIRILIRISCVSLSVPFMIYAAELWNPTLQLGIQLPNMIRSSTLINSEVNFRVKTHNSEFNARIQAYNSEFNSRTISNGT